MARPRHEHPTPGELEVLQILWEGHPRSVRQVMEKLNQTRTRAYTSVMSLMNTMVEKRLLRRKPMGKAYLYSPARPREKTIAAMAGDLLDRAFAGSANTLMAHLLNQAKPSQDELEEIKKTISEYQKQQTKNQN